MADVVFARRHRHHYVDGNTYCVATYVVVADRQFVFDLVLNVRRRLIWKYRISMKLQIRVICVYVCNYLNWQLDEHMFNESMMRDVYVGMRVTEAPTVI